VTTSAEERHLAQRMLLHLHAATPWEGLLASQVATAVEEGTQLLLVHEQREGRGAVPFGDIISKTPPHLSHIYKSELALPMYDGDDFRRVCLRVMLHKFAGAAAPPQRRAMHRAPVQVAAPPLLLEMSAKV
jgi:hypothetical protein